MNTQETNPELALETADVAREALKAAYKTVNAVPGLGFHDARESFYEQLRHALHKNHERTVNLVEAYELLKKHAYPFMSQALPTNDVTTVEKERYYAENIAYALADKDGLGLYYKMDIILENTAQLNRTKPKLITLLKASFGAGVAGLIGSQLSQDSSTLNALFEGVSKAGVFGISGSAILGVGSVMRQDSLEKQLRELEGLIYEMGTLARPHAKPSMSEPASTRS